MPSTANPSNSLVCRHGDECRTKGCKFNHPSRMDCRNGANCARSDCYYNHATMVCHFNEKCTKKARGGCHFRHTGPGQAGPSVQQPPDIQSVPRPPQARDPCKAENSAVARQSQLIRNEQRKVALFAASPEFDPENDATMKTLTAYQARIRELENQLLGFQAVAARAKGLMPDPRQLSFQMKREIYRLRSGLPALAKRNEIETHVESQSSRFLIVQGETGSGKSTQVVQYLADHPRFLGKRIVCTQPRKIAAISLANRVTYEYAGGVERAKVGFQVGYHVGGQRRCFKANHCRVEFVTEGIMLGRIISGGREPFEGVGAIVVDEAHERSKICDLLLGCFRLNDPRWADIMIIVTSATIDLEVFSQYFDGAPTVEIAGRCFPVDIKYSPIADPEGADVPAAVVSCAVNIHKALKQTAGDILCFLPGQEDVVRAKDSFDSTIARLQGSDNLLLATTLTLYGRQDPEDQAQAFAKLPPTQRKIIFSTDIAETSVTIDGIVYVVDSGVRKEMTFDHRRNISSLKVNQISRGSAIQRAGRAGRTRPGICYRLYSAEDYDRMEPSAPPEIFRRPLSLAILTLKELQIDSDQFRWISAPNPNAIAAAEQELVWLGALTPQGCVTSLGKLVIQSQEEPKLVRMIWRGCDQGLGKAAATLAAIFSVSNVFFWPGNTVETKTAAKEARKAVCNTDGDFVTLYKLHKQWAAILEGISEQEVLPEVEMTLQSPEQENVGDDPEELQFDVAGLVPPAPPIWDGEEQEGLEDTELNSIPSAADEEDASETQSNSPTEASGVPSEASSMQEEMEEIDAELLRERTRRGKKLASAWCRHHFINGKAVSLIRTRAKELEAVFRHTDAWMASEEGQEREPTHTELNRLICSGFYLNCARLFHSKSRARQYFAVFNETIGNLDFKSALLQGDSAESQDWIIYDKILQTSLVLFPMATPIQLEWLQEETNDICPQLYVRAVVKAELLPTERVVKFASVACLRGICGKYFCNLPALEQQLDSAVQVDLGEGRIQVFCTGAKKPEIERVIDEKLAGVVRAFEVDTVEAEYTNGAAGGTRALVTQGYAVKEILFPGEYATLHIRKLPPNCSEHEITNFLVTNGVTGILSIALTTYQKGSAVAIKFEDKESAKRAYEGLRNQMFHEKPLEIAQPEMVVGGASKNVRLRQSCQLIVSWATGTSIGKAFLTFRTPSDANFVIESVGTLFAGARVTRVHGELHPTATSDRAKTPRLVERAAVGVGALNRRGLLRHRPQQLFDTVQRWPIQELQFAFTVADLPRHLDEFAIQEVLARVPIVPSRVTVTRNAPSAAASARQRAAFLAPLHGPRLGTDNVTTEFVQKNHRAGVRIVIPDQKRAREAYAAASADYRQMDPFNGQPIRFELQRTWWTSIHTDLYDFFQSGIERVKACARANGVATSNTDAKRASPFVSLWFRSDKERLLTQVQARLQETIAYRVFNHTDRELLFTCTGRKVTERLAKLLTKKALIHLDTRTHSILIYGCDRGQELAERELVVLIKLLQEFEELDRLLVLHLPVQVKGKLPGSDGKKIETQIDSICQKHGANYWHREKNRLYVTGTKSACNAIEDALQQEQLLRRKRATASGARTECGICFCQLDRNFQTTSICGHSFCTECVQPMFETVPPPVAPIACPECAHPLAVQDVVKFASSNALQTVVDHVVNLYTNEHPDRVTRCPKPGCNQLLPASDSTAAALFCFACQLTYCVECSEKTGKAAEAHPGESCAESQRGLPSALLRHLKHIRENLLNHKCPRCKAVVFDFEGCCAVSCTCGCAFCGICFEDCGRDAHAHVTRCPRNPSQGQLFLNAAQLRGAHNEVREEGLALYIRSLEGEELRGNLRKYLAKDLQDLGLNCDQIFS